MTGDFKPTHLQRFAHDMITRHGPRSPGMIWVAYVNVVGNDVPGASTHEQTQSIIEELKQDPRLEYDAAEHEDGLGWFKHARD